MSWGERGYQVFDGFAVEPWLAILPQVRAGTRRLSDHPRFAEVLKGSKLAELAQRLAGPVALARALLFDKRNEANWSVPWHQDLSLAVAERREVAGYGPWSVKEGIPHVQPPLEVLEGMLALRLHLDDCGPENGPLRLVPGSHRQGISSAISTQGEVTCCCQAGQVLAMRPLLWHASARANETAHRRVVHLEFCPCTLPGGLRPYAGA